MGKERMSKNKRTSLNFKMIEDILADGLAYVSTSKGSRYNVPDQLRGHLDSFPMLIIERMACASDRRHPLRQVACCSL